MTAPDITLKQAKESAGVKTHRASDFLTQEQMDDVHKSNAQGKKKLGFDEVDAYIAEILARFGYDTYMAWKAGDIDEEVMLRYIEAERTREIRSKLALESLIVASVAGANHPNKDGHAPKSLKTAINILKKEQQLAGGVK